MRYWNKYEKKGNYAPAIVVVVVSGFWRFRW